MLDIALGQAPYSFVWQNADNSLNGSGSVAIQDGDGMIDNLPPGNYFVTVTDAWGEATSDALVIEPEILSAVMTSTTTSCFSFCDGGASITVEGGTMPYQYFWPNGSITTTVYRSLFR